MGCESDGYNIERLSSVAAKGITMSDVLPAETSSNYACTLTLRQPTKKEVIDFVLQNDALAEEFYADDRDFGESLFWVIRDLIAKPELFASFGRVLLRERIYLGCVEHESAVNKERSQAHKEACEVIKSIMDDLAKDPAAYSLAPLTHEYLVHALANTAGWVGFVEEAIHTISHYVSITVHDGDVT